MKFMVLIRFISLALCLSFNLPSHSGAWALEKGARQTIITGAYDSADRRFDDTGALQTGSQYEKLETRIYAERGLTDTITLVSGGGFQKVDLQSQGLAPQSYFGPVPTELGLRKQFIRRDKFVFSVQGSVIFASAGENMPEAKLGDGSINYEIRGLTGRSFTLASRPGFMEVQAAYRARPSDASDEWRLDVTTGLDIRPNLQLLAQAFVISSANPRAGGATAYKSVKIQPSLVYKSTNARSYQIGGFATISGEYALAERGLFIGLWQKY
ncbi:MAG: hypothetical protein V3U82_05040 [Robiginitomaculum sp.]